MSDAPFTNAGALHHDGDIVDIVGTTAGPAGVAVMELANGEVLQVDYAEPQLLVGISTSPTDLVEGTLVRDLLGEETAADAVDALRRGGRGPRPLNAQIGRAHV